MGSEVFADRKSLFELQMVVGAGHTGDCEAGVEVGGLLLGTSGTEARIKAVLPLHIEHRFGPYFWLSPADIEMAKRDIELAEDGEQGSAIGHFRSLREGEPEATDIDHAVADLLTAAEPILLLVPPGKPGPMQAAVYRRKSGTWVPVLRCPVESIPPLTTEPRPRVEPVLTEIPAPAVAATASTASWKLRGELVAAMLVVAAALLWGSRLLMRHGSPTVPANTAISLEAQATGNTINVRWNHISPEILQATSATLSIQDGDRQRELRLSREQLLDGSVAYAPVNSQVTFRLEVYRDAEHFTRESVSVRALAAPNPSPMPAATPFPHPPAKTAVASRPQAALLQSPISVEIDVRADSRPVHERDRSAAVFSAPRPAAAPNPALAMPPPTVAMNPPAVPAALGEWLNSQPIPEAQITYVAATPRQKTRPAIPAKLRAVIDSVVSVNVKVMIDAGGKVVSAAPLDTTTTAQRLLAPEAVQAARLWRFDPARRNGLPVSSESTLRFDFQRR